MHIEKEWVPYSNKCSLYIRPTLIGTQVSFIERSSFGSYLLSWPAEGGFPVNFGGQPIISWRTACATDWSKILVKIVCELCWNPCVFGPQLCIRFWVYTMIRLLKKPLSVSVWQSGWTEIWNTFPAICCVSWWPRTRISVLLWRRY